MFQLEMLVGYTSKGNWIFFFILYSDQQMLNYFTHYHTPTRFDNILPTSESFNLLAPVLFFLILAHSAYKMWIIQEPNKLELWNKLHFEEEKKNGELHTMFKIFGTYIC